MEHRRKVKISLGAGGDAVAFHQKKFPFEVAHKGQFGDRGSGK